MVDVIAFLIEHFQDFEACPAAEDLGQILEDVGFDDAEIGNALVLLEVLRNRNEHGTVLQHSGSLRIYCAEEQDALSVEVINFMHFLEKAGAVNSEQREFVIHALLHLPFEEITLDMAKLVTLLVLWAQQAELPVLVGDELMMVLHGKAVMN